MKGYYIIGKKTLAVVGVFVLMIGTLAVFGVRQAVVGISASARMPNSLPIYSVELPEGEKKVSIGVNCAWGNEDIPDILDALDELDVKLTFFMVGDFCDNYPETVKEISDRGHEIGNHSDSHPDMTMLSEQQIADELEQCSEKIENIIGKRPELFRAPSGSYNDTVVKTAEKTGYYVIQWDCDSVDWQGKTPEEMEQRIFKTLNTGSILLFHNDTDHTAEALPGIIQKIMDDGYEIVPVGELIYRENYAIDNAGRQFATDASGSLSIVE